MENTRDILNNGIELEYRTLEKLTSTEKLYKIKNNLPSISNTKALHVRPSAKNGCYYNNPSVSMKLPAKAQWINKPVEFEWIKGKRHLNV
ncbi:hypothetical protein BU055_09615 [Staphylococcus succinus]|uniref:hypothetical protein n=1 Tax=Staphylococcus succinus TaxID=61015 RepID=UPI000D1EE874|nr:hypothetical protein [Staphylococcus succinus]PTJ82344.1 hypothetical protein BU055_09615 [Staphylococcus succinus]